MVGLDTNVVLRLLLGDDPAQQRAALSYVEKACSAEDPGWISAIVTTEIVWVLDRAYNLSRDDIADAIDRLLAVNEFQLEDHEEVRRALAAFRGGSDFTDALLDERNRAAGCQTTVTFDRDAARKLIGFTDLAVV